MVIMHPLYTLSLLYVLSSSIFRVNADGETTSITLECGKIKNLSSPDYPKPYGNNLEIHWDVQADLTQRIVVTFHDFHTENYDTLHIVEENYPSARAKYSGSKMATPYLSLGNHLEVIFRSDESESRKGFHLSLSCLTHTEHNTDIHEAFEGFEHIRVLTQTLCRNAWHMDVADTICREAGFPGAYETTLNNTTSGSNETSYICKTFTHRLQDCENFTSSCTDAYKSVVINCNVLGQLGCFELANYTRLLSRSVKLSRDQCLTHCNSYSAMPQYAVHHSGTNCSCIDQTALDVTKLTTNRNLCRTDTTNPTGHWVTLYNASFGFCSKPPELDNGSWNNSSNGCMYDTTVTAKCNDNYELVDGHRKMRCDRATTSTTQDFEWHGTTPSCRKRNTGSADNESFSGSGKILKSNWQLMIVSFFFMYNSPFSFY
ncbi:uncharacterized protein LOC105445673 [Strongylocentrotus purpuratus]|uniref:Uncharacterized protein n=1 Tax=Strongylocentrotus purpuratus TaxID=7668 RepID=A0A7M7N3J0_STRPU|nr:uncharacterized protein LOC105445673 [Strongylocentrotus purpuratus]